MDKDSTNGKVGPTSMVSLSMERERDREFGFQT